MEYFRETITTLRCVVGATKPARKHSALSSSNAPPVGHEDCIVSTYALKLGRMAEQARAIASFALHPAPHPLIKVPSIVTVETKYG